MSTFAGHNVEAIAWCRRVRELQPDFAGAWWLEGTNSLVVGDDAHGLEALDRCLELSPGATSCRIDLFELAANNGRCGDALTHVEKIVAAEPESRTWRFHLALALHSTGAPTWDVGGQFEASWQSVPEAERPTARAADETLLSIDQHHYSFARRHLRALDAALVADTDEHAHSRATLLRARLEEELGNSEGAVTVLRQFLARRSALVPFPGDEIVAAAELYRLGAMARTDFLKAQAAAVEAGRQPLTTDPSLASPGWTWIRAFAGPALTLSEARNALTQLDASRPLPQARLRDLVADWKIGHVYLIAGRNQEAIEYLRRAKGSCLRLAYPFEHLDASLELGIALESVDRGEACATYAQLEADWGRELRTTREAARRGRVLGCP